MSFSEPEENWSSFFTENNKKRLASMGTCECVLKNSKKNSGGEPEPPYFRGAGAVIFIKNSSGSWLSKIRDFYQL